MEFELLWVVCGDSLKLKQMGAREVDSINV